MTRVLIVDDKPENLYLLRVLLEGHGCTVDEARHGAEALVKASQSPPQVIISDLLMPVMDGYTLLRQWKADDRLKAIPFVVYTATYTEPKDERLALDLGADAFILKPAEPEPFVARIQEILAKEARQDLPPPDAPQADEKVLLKEYSEVLIRKLEEKAIQLEQTNRALEQDITERKQAEEALSMSEERLRLALRAAGMGVFEWELPTRKLTLAPEVFEIFGLPAGTPQPSFEDVPRFVHPQDRPLCEEQAVLLVAGKPIHFDCRIIRPTSEVRWVEISGKGLFDDAGQPVRYLGICRDITERKSQEEQRFQLLAKEQEARAEAESAKAEVTRILESITDAFVVLDRDWRYTYVNEKAAQLFGRGRNDLIGKHISTEFPEGVGQPFRLACEKAVAEQVPADIEAYNAPWNRWFENRIYPSQEGLCITFHDITNRKQAERNLQQSLGQLRILSTLLQAAREEERTAVARELHDEIGQVLTALKFDISWLARRLPKNEKEILGKVDSALALADTGLQWTRKMCAQLRPGILDDLGLVAALEWQAKEFESRTNIRCVVSLPPEPFELDPERSTAVFRIFQEALTNVSRHAEASLVDVSLRQESGALLLVVKDNGKGIDENDLVQKDSFGLLGMRERALVFGGNVEFRGTRGQGTTLSVSIPLAAGRGAEGSDDAIPTGR